MRIIKLSTADSDMVTKEAVDVFFRKKLLERDPSGKFRLTKGRLSESGIVSNERLLFTYMGQCVYQARSASGRIRNEDADSEHYPFYFCVSMDSVVETSGSLSDLEWELNQQGLLSKNLVQSQGWPSIDETQTELNNTLDRMLGKV